VSFALFVALAARSIASRSEGARTAVYGVASVVIVAFAVMTVFRNPVRRMRRRPRCSAKFEVSR
jgi:hypothetical protein